MSYVAILRTKRHYNFQIDYSTIEAFDEDMEKKKKGIVWAILIDVKEGEFVKRVDGDYV